MTNARKNAMRRLVARSALAAPLLLLLPPAAPSAVGGFVPLPPLGRAPNAGRTAAATSATSLRAAALDTDALARRRTILGRSGEYFDLDRSTGRVTFGSTAELITDLEGSDGMSVCRWLSDERRVASSIWDEDLITDLGGSVYRLELMALRFVTVQLAPWVDVRMWTDLEARTRPSGAPIDIPLFQLQSVGFDPNVQILPGVGVSAESLGIDIEVAGELRPSKNGRGVTGRIGFVSSGDLTPPMRILPEPALRAAGDAISRTVRDFAVRSFREGAARQYAEYRGAEMVGRG